MQSWCGSSNDTDVGIDDSLMSDWLLYVRLTFVGHVSRSYKLSCEWSRVAIMWLILWTWHYNCLSSWTQAPLSVKAVCWGGVLNGNLVKKPPTKWKRLKRKTGRPWKHSSPIGKLISLKRSCHWWKTSQPSYGKLRRKTGQRINW